VIHVWEQRMARTMVELADTLVAGVDVIEFLQLLAERCLDVLEVDAVGVLLADERGVLNLMAASPEQAPVLELFLVQQDEGPALECYRTGALVTWTAQGAGVEPDRWPRFARRAVGSGFASAQAAPMRLGDRTIGVVTLVRRVAEPTPEATTLAQSFADMASISIPHIRSRTYQEVLAEQLRSALHDRITVEQAKGVLAERRQTGVAEAFAAMRAWARREHRPVVDVARAVLNGDGEVVGLLTRDA
jgi:GAF domain-containing protein